MCSRMCSRRFLRDNHCVRMCSECVFEHLCVRVFECSSVFEHVECVRECVRTFCSTVSHKSVFGSVFECVRERVFENACSSVFGPVCVRELLRYSLYKWITWTVALRQCDLSMAGARPRTLLGCRLFRLPVRSRPRSTFFVHLCPLRTPNECPWGVFSVSFGDDPAAPILAAPLVRFSNFGG